MSNPSPGSRLAGLVVCALALSGLLGGCGGSSHSASGTTTAGGTGGSAKSQVAHVWTEFFASSTPPATKSSLLENGAAFARVITAESKSPLASQSSARVTSVQMTGPGRARVTYDILLAGKPALKHRTGLAVKSGGSWKVSTASFCSLLALEGTAPPPCPKA